jgi:phage/plasmid-associated DNA primase
MFKTITRRDGITAEVKYRDSFEFTPFARLLFSVNWLPASSDASQAYFDRWLIVAFANRFHHTRREIPRRILEWTLCLPAQS